MTYSIVLVAKPQSINFILIYHRRNYWPRQKAIRQRISLSLYYTTIDRRKPNLGENMMSSTLWTQWIAKSEFHPDLKIQMIFVGYLFWISFYFVYISKTRFNISNIGIWWSIIEGGSRSDHRSTFLDTTIHWLESRLLHLLRLMIKQRGNEREIDSGNTIKLLSALFLKERL